MMGDCTIIFLIKEWISLCSDSSMRLRLYKAEMTASLDDLGRAPTNGVQASESERG